MKSRTTILGAAALAGGFIAVAPKAALNPGPVTTGHARGQPSG